MIYLTNDLFSFEKERELNDFHNLVMLLMHHKELNREEARKTVLELHQRALHEFNDLGNTLNENDPRLKIFQQLEYQVAGAVAWSLEDTTRYYSIEKKVNIK